MIFLATGFEDAFLGLGRQVNNEFSIYDYDKCIQILISQREMTEEEAQEYFELNIVGAYLETSAPVYVRKMSFFAMNAEMGTKE